MPTVLQRNTAGNLVQLVISSNAGAGVKAGTALAAAFAGGSMTAAVAFATAFPDTNYAITLGVVVNGNANFVPVVRNKTAAGFTIDMHSHAIAQLVEVTWIAAPYGE